MNSAENRPMQSDRSSFWKKAVVYVLILTATIIAVWLSYAAYGLISEKVSPAVPAPLHKIEPNKDVKKPDLETIIQSRAVQDADAALQMAVEDSVNEIHLFFESARANSPVFAEQMLDMGSKVRLVSDSLPFTRDDRFEKHMQQCFNETIFSEETLTQVLKSVEVRFETYVQGIEKEMLVNLSELFPEVFSNLGDDKKTDGQKLYERYNEAMNKVIAENRSHVSSEIKVGVMGEITGFLVPCVTRKFLVSAGILAAGASSSAYTAGIGFVAAIVGDLLISWAWDWYADPEGEIARSVNEQLNLIEAFLIDGDEEQAGFRKMMTDGINDYIQNRNKAFARVIQ